MNPINLGPYYRHDYSGLENIQENFQKGRELHHAPEKMTQEMLAQHIKNQIEGVNAKYAEPKAQADLQKALLQNQYYPDITEAQIQHYKDQASGRGYAPSALGKLIQERADLMANDPHNPLVAEYDRAIKAAGGAKKFAPTGLGKLYTERQEVEEGFLPGSDGQIPLTPTDQKKLLDRYDLQIQKTTTDSGIRKTVLQGKNLLKSMEASDIDALTRYSGPAGSAKLKYEQTKDLSGNGSEDYYKYLEALQAVKLEAKELRQFFGDSITNEASKALDEMVNATSLGKSPEAAKRMIQKSRDIIKKQIQTFSDSLENTDQFKLAQVLRDNIGEEGGGPGRVSQAQQYSEEDIQTTMQQTGWPREKVLQALQGKRNG